jgi:hypothetical protein
VMPEFLKMFQLVDQDRMAQMPQLHGGLNRVDGRVRSCGLLPFL